jgi:hypothetical protein
VSGFDAERHARSVNFASSLDDWAIASLEDRVSAIEETLAARWPRRVLLRRRLGRQLRASARTYAWAGRSFRARRTEAAGYDILTRAGGRQS